ncbi:urease subunit gamma/beta [Streptomyces umbrinus]|uniref:urease subunit gamma n=1 Tax=Streptomyces umbrinus TaxID=67370 RepID=UPI00167997DE|nr:urease subunit gamma [Streptomyces umbrinus]GHB81960.1 urease subunit gamma/beta [Streptomyces umbrinus]
MRLTPAEQDRLQLYLATLLARERRARGVRLNVPEATALIAHAACEAARDGARLADAAAAARQVLTADDVLPGVPQILTEIQVEAVFDDGTKLIVITDPIPNPDSAAAAQAVPGAVLTGEPAAVVPTDPVQVEVTNTGPVAITVTSHFHFLEANRALVFDRRAAYGRRLALAVGEVTVFPPRSARTVTLTPIGGDRIVIGFAGLVDGPLDTPGQLEAALRRAHVAGYLDTGSKTAQEGTP